MGHYRKRHILKNLAFSSAVILLSLWFCGLLYAETIAVMGYAKVHDVAALPVLLLYLSVLGLALMPLTNALSRRYEVQADAFALETTRDRKAFVSSMEKLAAMNLADRQPHAFKEFFFYSHPSINRRIAFAETFRFARA
jgi:STE24 endopeptidase